MPSLLHPPKQLFICKGLAFCEALRGVCLHRNLFQTSHPCCFPPATGITPWIPQCLSVRVSSTASSLPTAWAVHGAMGGCRFGALLAAAGLNSRSHPSHGRSSGAAPGTPSPARVRHSVFSGATCRHFIGHGHIPRGIPPSRGGHAAPIRSSTAPEPSLPWFCCCWCFSSWSQAPKCRSRLHDSQPCGHSDRRWGWVTSWEEMKKVSFVPRSGLRPMHPSRPRIPGSLQLTNTRM